MDDPLGICRVSLCDISEHCCFILRSWIKAESSTDIFLIALREAERGLNRIGPIADVAGAYLEMAKTWLAEI